MAYDRNNVFARILREELPAHRVYEDAHTLAFMDVMPQVDGHTLVIPRAEAEFIYDLPAEPLAALALTTQRVARAVQKAFDAPGIMIAQLNGRAAGQSVFHLHFHVIPRHRGIELGFHARDMADPTLLAGHAARIRAALD
jgi:histidine triad (HIT) family protein